MSVDGPTDPSARRSVAGPFGSPEANELWRAVQVHAACDGRRGAVHATCRRLALEQVRKQLEAIDLADGTATGIACAEYDARFEAQVRQRIAAGSDRSFTYSTLVESVHRSRFCTPSILPDHEPAPLSIEYETSLSDRRLGSSTEGSGVFEQVERRLADAHGAARAFPFLDGSTSAIRAVAEWISQWCESPLVGVNRIAHKAVIHALDAHRVPWYYLDHPGWDVSFDAVAPLDPSCVPDALERHPDTSHLWCNSVTYEGAIADVAAIRTKTDAWSDGGLSRRRPALVVDEAWGAHLRFHSCLRGHRALDNGADIVTTSVHKQGGGRQGTAVLLVAHRVPEDDRRRIEATVRSTVTTSPNLPLLASLEAATGLLVDEGEARIGESMRLADDLATGLETTKLVGRDPQGRPARPSGTPTDPLKVVVDVHGRSGFDVAVCLSDLDVVVERDGFHSVLFLVPFQVDDVDIGLAIDAAARAARDCPPVTLACLPSPFDSDRGRRERSGSTIVREVVVLGESEGRVAADIVAAYPPGIPVIAPGDEITPLQVEYLQAVVARGGHVVSGAGLAGDEPALYVDREGSP